MSVADTGEKILTTPQRQNHQRLPMLRKKGCDIYLCLLFGSYQAFLTGSENGNQHELGCGFSMQFQQMSERRGSETCYDTSCSRYTLLYCEDTGQPEFLPWRQRTRRAVYPKWTITAIVQNMRLGRVNSFSTTHKQYIFLSVSRDDGG